MGPGARAEEGRPREANGEAGARGVAGFLAEAAQRQQAPGSERAPLGGGAGPRKRDPRKQEGTAGGGRPPEAGPQEAGPQEARGHRWGAARAPRSGTPGSKTEPLAGGRGPIVWSPKGLGPESERSPFEGFPGDPVCQAPCGRQPGDPGRDGCPHHLSWGGGGCRGVSVPRPTGPQWVGGSLSPGPARWTEEGERQQEEGCPGPWGL